MKYGIDTRCQHLADDNKDEIYGAISYPIYQSATFARDRVGGGSGSKYYVTGRIRTKSTK